MKRSETSPQSTAYSQQSISKRIYRLLTAWCLLPAAFFLLPAHSSAQFVSGLYSGTVQNDSTGKVQNYELGLSEYRGRITGYSYTTFVSNDTFYYSIKRVRGTRKEGQLLVEDERILAHNFPQAPDKGVRVTNTIALPQEDTLRSAQGRWSTNRTRIFYSIGGGLALRRSSDSAASPLIGHLRELNLIENNAPQTAPAAASTTPAGKPVPPAPIAPMARPSRSFGEITLSGDSLRLSFYDNGTVDGDTISVYLDGQPLLTRLRLTAAASRLTIPLKGITGNGVLLIVAENEGSLPPNTGLIVAETASGRQQVTFSAGLQVNATLTLRPSKP